ncbi:radical SAM protein [bacterium]|nr:radical SAM protein [bacterium]
MRFQVNEIFYSIQGESTYIGIPTIFIRFTGCSLRCSYCDTQYAFFEGESLTIDEIIEKIASFKTDYICLTGGEPLEQKDIISLIKKLLELNKVISIETSGAVSIKNIPSKAKIVMDIKTPSSNMSELMLLSNIEMLKSSDEVKFVCQTEADIDWSIDFCKKYELYKKAHILFSPVLGVLNPQVLVEKILSNSIPNTRVQIQIHKVIWNPDTKGV